MPLPLGFSDPFEAAAARTRQAVQPQGGRQEGLGTFLVQNVLKGLMSLPQRATQAAGELQRQGDVYDPGPALETALLTMGATPFSAPRGAIGAGPTRLKLEIARREPVGSQYPNSYVVTDHSGQELARMTAKVDGDIARIENIYTDRNPALASPGLEREGVLAQQRNTLGLAAIRDLLRQFREIHPEVNNITGERVSGARLGGGYTTGKGIEANVQMPLAIPQQ